MSGVKDAKQRLADPVGTIVQYCKDRYDMPEENTVQIVARLHHCERRDLLAQALAETGLD